MSSNSRSINTNTTVVLATVAVTVLTALATAWYRRRRFKRDREVVAIVQSDRSKSVPPGLWKAFEEAAHRIRTDGKSLQLTNGDKLMFYGLYKQIVDGNAPEKSAATGWNIVVEQAKHSAWCKMRGMPIETAIAHYLDAANHFTREGNGVAAASPSSSTSEQEEFGEDAVTGGLGPAVISLPVVENGGFSYSEEDDSVEARLLRAAGENNVVALNTILSAKDVNVNYADESGQTALHLAADKGSSECVNALIKAGCNVNAADYDGISVLQAAVIAGHVETSKLLLLHGADPDHADDDGDTPRSCAGDDGDKTMKHLFSFEVPLKK